MSGLLVGLAAKTILKLNSLAFGSEVTNFSSDS